MIRSPLLRSELSNRFVRVAHLHTLRDCEQVAAVCYRVRGNDIDFLLVRTRGSGRWTFPKGSTEPGLTHAQAAALEAFEEAGVHGRIEEASFVRYVCRKRNSAKKSAARSIEEISVRAHLCQVFRLGNPKESKRNPTWFSAKDSRRRLRERRDNDEGLELLRVVDKAVTRIQRLRGEAMPVAGRPSHESSRDAFQKDALQKVHLEAVINVHARTEALIPYIRRLLSETRQSPMLRVDAKTRGLLPGEVLQFTPAKAKKPQPLGNGTRNR